MGKSSRILIREQHLLVCRNLHHLMKWEKDECIVRPGYRIPKEEARFLQAPEPLLPNYGEARIRQYTVDINMMTVLNAKERTLEDFIVLGESSGLLFVKLWEAGELAVVEFVQAHERWTYRNLICRFGFGFGIWKPVFGGT